METGESVVRILGGAAVGVGFALILRVAPAPLAQTLVMAVGVGVVVLLLLLLLGLGRRGLLVMGIVASALLLAGVVSETVAQTAWAWLRLAAGVVASGIRAATHAPQTQMLITWGVVGALLNLLAGSVEVSSLKRSL